MGLFGDKTAQAASGRGRSREEDEHGQTEVLTVADTIPKRFLLAVECAATGRRSARSGSASGSR